MWIHKLSNWRYCELIWSVMTLQQVYLKWLLTFTINEWGYDIGIESRYIHDFPLCISGRCYIPCFWHLVRCFRKLINFQSFTHNKLAIEQCAYIKLSWLCKQTFLKVENDKLYCCICKHVFDVYACFWRITLYRIHTLYVIVHDRRKIWQLLIFLMLIWFSWYSTLKIC